LIKEIVVCIVDVSRRCVTGNIDPCIRVVETDLAKPIAQTMLSSSITYTPGTVVIDVDSPTRRIFVGCINPKTRDEIIPMEPHVKGWLEK
jgi:energy-converting hydrogenase B subunit A